jgi:hypothetical protein
MSFVYKKINPSYISLNQYEVNKDYSISYNDIDIFMGEYIPINKNQLFDIINNEKTTNDEYRRLIFYSIKHLYYNNYFFNNFISSSLYDNYLQTTLNSGSYTTTLRQIGTNEGIQDNINLYDNLISNYDDENIYDYNRGSLINILSLKRNKIGNYIKPKSFIISDKIYIRDDGEGNIFDYGNEEEYKLKQQQHKPGDIYVGNIIYSHGLIIITNPDYICLIPSPPIAINDYYSYNNLLLPLIYDITRNDYSDCNNIDYNSIELIPGSSSLDCFINNDGFLELIPSQSLFIPGNYQIGYTIKNYQGISSNIGYVNINIFANPLIITVLNNDKICYPNIDDIEVNYQVKIEGGTPKYSYSWDNINYTEIDEFFNVILEGETSSNNNILYIKDFQNQIIETPINFFYPEIDYNILLISGNLYNNTGSINIQSNNGLIYSIEGITIDNNNISSSYIYNTNTNYFIPSGYYTASIKDENDCLKNINFELNNQDPITFNIINNSVSCNGGNNGNIIISNIQGGTNSYEISLQSNFYSSSSIYYNSPITFNNLSSGNYILYINDLFTGNTQDSIGITINQSPSLILSLTSSYDNSCYSNIYINITGGIPPYNYEILTPISFYNTNDMEENKLNLYNDSLNNFTASIRVIDDLGCSVTSSIEIYGREYIYSGSYCENI